MLNSEIDRLRDEFAMAALTGITAATSTPEGARVLDSIQKETGLGIATINAKMAYSHANAMLEERKNHAAA